MKTVAILNFSGDGSTFDWHHNDGSSQGVSVSTLPHASSMFGPEDKGTLVVECSACAAKTIYPMSGGEIAQTLHKNFLRQKSLGDVQADASERSLNTSGKTQDQLIDDIIQDECSKHGVPKRV
jgi:hypothetical protein